MPCIIPTAGGTSVAVGCTLWEIYCTTILGTLGVSSLISCILGNTGHLGLYQEQISGMGPSVSGFGDGVTREDAQTLQDPSQ